MTQKNYAKKNKVKVSKCVNKVASGVWHRTQDPMRVLHLKARRGAVTCFSTVSAWHAVCDVIHAHTQVLFVFLLPAIVRLITYY